MVLTVMRDRDDYRKVGTMLSFGVWGRWQSLAFSFLVFAMLTSLLAEQIVGAITLGVVGLGALVLFLTGAARALRALPDWAFAPTTFTVSAEGVQMESPAARRAASWASLQYARKLSVAYVFAGPGQTPIALPRRQLTTEDEAALDAVLDRYRDRLGDPSAVFSTTPAAG